MSIRDKLEQLGVRPSKRRGQNFLTDQNIVRNIVRFSGVTKDSRVLEIGPGLGMLTRAIAEAARLQAVVEIEEKFCAYLKTELPADTKIISADIRLVELDKILSGGEKVYVLSNAPYSISTDIVLWVFKNKDFINSATILLQREFAERLAAGPGSRDYGRLSVLAAVQAEVELGPVVAGDRFYPRAEVDSRLLKLVPLSELREGVADLGHFERVVQGAFGKRRKTLKNSLRSAFGADVDVKTALERAGIDPKRRAETLNLAEFAALAKCL